MSEDPIYTVAEAAYYCGVTKNAIRQCVKAAKLPWLRKQAAIQGRLRLVMAIAKSDLDTFRANGFLFPAKRGRRKGGRLRANAVV